MLEKYNKKRHFDKSGEPEGTISKSKTESKTFVVQHHMARREHYDFRLEHDGVLLSWAVPKGLSSNPKIRRLAVHVEDHPTDYANFEGIIPTGNYGAGSVEIDDKGNYMPLIDIDKGLKKGHIKVLLNGEKYKGVWSIIKTDEKNWLIIKSKDEFSSDTITAKPKSDKNPFKTTTPMLATLSHSLPKGRGWLYEIKYDGYRILSFKEKERAKLLTRNGLDYTKKFNEIATALGKLKHNFVVDGEIVSFDKNGRSDFGLLQESIKKGSNNFVYMIFDLLALNGKDLRKTPLIERKALLETLLKNCPSCLAYSSHVEDKGKQSFDLAKKLNLEGVMAKRKDSFYQQSRSDDWLKIKCYKRQEFVVGGFITSDKNPLLSAIVVGYYDDGKLIFAGKVGTGFNEESRKELSNKFKKNAIKTSPFSNKDLKENIVWIKPKYVAEIQYSELTKSGLLRQPSFIGLREDKKAKDVVLEGDKNERN